MPSGLTGSRPLPSLGCRSGWADKPARVTHGGGAGHASGFSTERDTRSRRRTSPRAARVPSFEAYQELHRRSLEDPEGFWREVTDQLHLVQAMDDSCTKAPPPYVQWFADGETNISVNCLDRHVDAGRGDRVAYYWEGEPGDTRTITYADLAGRRAAICQWAQSPGAGNRRPRGAVHADGSRTAPWPCWPARAWAWCTAWCSAGSARTLFATGLTMPAPA